MEVFFADDSTQKSRREGVGSVIGVGGVLLEENAVRPLAAAVDQIAREFGVPEGDELKWSPKKGSWIHTNLHSEAREECYRRVLNTAAEHNAKAIAVCWSLGHGSKNPYDAFDTCIKYLFERLSVNLAKRQATGIIVTDRPGGGKDQEDRFLSTFLERVQSGTDYVVPDHVLLNVLTTPSHLVRHLQLADLIAGITTAKVCAMDQWAAPLFPLVQKMLITNHMNGVAGTGLKIAPNGLENLYHWVLGEKLFHRGGGAVSYRLPSPNLCFATDPIKA